jgi:hypothetical protein
MFNLLKINLSRFIRGRYFILLYIISKNRYRITLIILADSRANGFAFINISYIICCKITVSRIVLVLCIGAC